MKFKSLAIASAVALTALGAQADEHSWGTHDLLESAVALTAGGFIFDTYAFSLGEQSDVASSISTMGNIGAGTYSLFSVGLDGVIGTSDDVGFAAWTYGGAPAVHTVSLASGDYYYSVFGVATGAAAYSINSAAAVTPIPEPETYALLGAGLGIVGFVGLRRRREGR